MIPSSTRLLTTMDTVRATEQAANVRKTTVEVVRRFPFLTGHSGC